MDKNQFAESIKQKYPQYASIDNETLANKMLEKYPQYASRIKQEPNLYEQIVSGVKKDFLSRAQTIGTAAQKAGEATGLEKVARIGQFPLRVAGQAAGAIGDVVGQTVSAITPQPIKDVASSAVRTVAQTAPVQSAMQAYGQLPEDVRGSIADITNIATTVTGAGATKGVTKAGMEAGQNVAKKVVKFTDEVPLIKGITPEKAVQQVKNKLREQLEGKRSTALPLEKAQSDILETISSNPRYYPDIDVENRVFNTTNAVQEIRKDLSAGATALDELFKKLDVEQGGVDYNTIVKNVQDNLFNEKNRSVFAASGISPFEDAVKVLNNMRVAYGENIPRSELWKVRQAIDQNIETLSDTNIKKTLRQDVRKAFAQTLENSVAGGDGQIVKRAMTEMQKLIEAKDYLETKVNASKLMGGKLTDIIRNATATAMGQTAGAGIGGALGGIGGAVVAYTGSKMIGNWLARNAISSAAERRALLKLLVEQPSVWGDIKKTMAGFNKSEKAQVVENLRQTLKEATPEVKKTLKEQFAEAQKSDAAKRMGKEGGYIKNPFSNEGDLMQEAKKYKTAEEFVKANSGLYHGTNANLEGGKLSFGKGGIKKGGQSGGLFLSDTPEVSNTFGSTLYHANPILKSQVIDLTSSEGKQIFKDYIGKTYKNFDGETSKFTKEDYDYMFTNGKADFATVSQYDELIAQITKKLGKRGIAFEEYAGGKTGKTYQILEGDVPVYTKSQLIDIWNKANKK